MLQRVDVGTGSSEQERDDDVGSSVRSPNLSGDLDELLDTRPVFRPRLHGYDRLQVDNYVSWAEDELVAARRAGDHLLRRLAACAAELAEYRRQPAPRPAPAAHSLDLSAVSERVREILRLASAEADDILDAAAEEADRIVADAETEAEARLQKTQQIKEAAIAAVDRLQERAQHDRSEAAAVLERARREAEDLLRAAAGERDRLAAEAAEQRARDEERARQDQDAAAALAAGRLLAVQEEVDDLRRQRDQAQQALRRLTDQIGEALLAVGVGGEVDEPNIVRDSFPEPVAY